MFNEPTQGKTCCLRRFLGSLRSLGMTCRWVVPVVRRGCIGDVSGTAHRPFPTVSLRGTFFYTTSSKKRTRPSPENCQLSTVNCQLSTVHCQLSTNCQLSIVNCQFPKSSTRTASPMRISSGVTLQSTARTVTPAAAASLRAAAKAGSVWSLGWRETTGDIWMTKST